MTSPDGHETHSATNSYLSSFSAETRKELSEEDTQAWTAIVTLLLGIISTGVILAVICVALTSR